MRKQKIRGHNRLQKQIEPWKRNNLILRQDLLESYERDHIDIVVHPWCDISTINSTFPEPNKLTKRKILAGLLDIYDNLKQQLDARGKPYYLKIWLYEPRVSKSQVVCAVGERILHYENIFNKIEYSYKRLGFYTKINSVNLIPLDNALNLME